MEPELPDAVYPVSNSLKAAWEHFVGVGVITKEDERVKQLHIVFNYGALYVLNMIANAMNKAESWDDINVVTRSLGKEFSAFQAWIQQEAARQQEGE